MGFGRADLLDEALSPGNKVSRCQAGPLESTLVFVVRSLIEQHHSVVFCKHQANSVIIRRFASFLYVKMGWLDMVFVDKKQRAVKVRPRPYLLSRACVKM